MVSTIGDDKCKTNTLKTMPISSFSLLEQAHFGISFFPFKADTKF